MSSVAVPFQPLKRLVLTGFMGSGKTTVGQLLAARLHWNFADLDQRIEAREGRSVPQLFAEQGEAAFRQAETQALAGLLSEEDLVLALGGGAPGTPANRDLLHNASQTAIVHLDAPFPVLYERCAMQALDPGATQRPLLGDRAAAEERHRHRSGVYAALAHHRAAADDRPERVADAILAMLALRLEPAR